MQLAELLEKRELAEQREKELSAATATRRQNGSRAGVSSPDASGSGVPSINLSGYRSNPMR